MMFWSLWARRAFLTALWYAAAVESLAQQKPEATAVELERLFGRRGNAHLALRQWQQAVDDYARVVTDTTTDEELLTNQATALAGVGRLDLGRVVETQLIPTSTLGSRR